MLIRDVHSAKHWRRHHIEKNEMGVACSTKVGDEKRVQEEIEGEEPHG
jgi:hypothetical protein